MIVDAIEILNQALTTTNNQIKRVEEIILRANVLLSKAELVHQAETIQLEE